MMTPSRVQPDAKTFRTNLLKDGRRKRLEGRKGRKEE